MGQSGAVLSESQVLKELYVWVPISRIAASWNLKSFRKTNVIFKKYLLKYRGFHAYLRSEWQNQIFPEARFENFAEFKVIFRLKSGTPINLIGELDAIF